MALLLIGSLRFLRQLFAARGAVRKRKFDSQEQLLEALYFELAQRTGKTTIEAQTWYQEKFLPAFVHLLKKNASARGGLISLLHQLRQANIKLGVVSDFGRVESRLQALDIPTELFDTLNCSEEFGVLKPAPEPFIEISQLWGMGANQILVVGDRDDRDGECAQNAGMVFLGITEKKSNRAEFYCWNDALRKIKARTNCGVSL